MPDDTSALRKAEKHKNTTQTTQQTPEIASIHTPLQGRILVSSDRNFLKFPEQMNSTIGFDYAGRTTHY